MEGRRFVKPVPLSFVTTILIYGWKRDGIGKEPTNGMLVPPDFGCFNFENSVSERADIQ